MKQIDIVIDNPTGLHARPAKYFVNLAKKFKSDIRVLREGKKANAKSLVSMLTLGVKRGYQISIVVEGADEDEAFDALKAAIDSGLGEGKQEPTVPAEKKAVQKASAPQEAQAPEWPSNEIRGIATAPGYAIGPVWQLQRSEIDIEETYAGSSEEQTRLQEAIEKARGQLTSLRKRMSTQLSAEEADIFNVHLELLEDPDLLEAVLEKLEAGESAAQAWQATIEKHAKAMAELDDPLLAARAADLHDVSYRVLRLLVGVEEQMLHLPDHPVIIIASDLSPSETAGLDKDKVLGFCTAAGGPTAHSAIIARAMGIPAIVSAGDKVLKIAGQTLAILDGEKGSLTIEPSEIAIAQAKALAEQYAQKRQAARASAANPAITTDGHRVHVVANIGGWDEARTVVESGAEGVGLMRTEFLFLGQEQAPSEDEQFQVYRDIVQVMQGQPIIFRTLDIGGDKPLPYIDVPPEENPFLGERGIRLCLNRPELLQQQLRAIYRAAAYGPVRIMFPMVSDLSEWRQVKALAEEIRIDLDVPQVELGIMIEIPSAALTAGAFAAEVDFFSVGTNDLTQYTLAIDRMHPTMSNRLDGLHPAVLRLIEHTIQAAKKHDKWVGVCGELAADPQALPILLGLGVAELSVSVPSVPSVKAQIRALALNEAQVLAHRALDCKVAPEVRALSIA